MGLLRTTPCLATWVAALSAMSYPGTAASSSPRPGTSLFDRLGGKPGTSLLASKFVDILAADKRLQQNPKIAAITRRTNKLKVKQRLGEKICAESGGPCKNPPEVLDNVPPEGKDLKLSSSEMIHVMDDAGKAMDAAKVPQREQFEILELLITAKGGV